VKIEKGIPVPPKKQSKKKQVRHEKYPFSKMEIGDSFLSKEPQARVNSSAYVFGKKTGMKFKIRSVGKGCRCWRIA